MLVIADRERAVAIAGVMGGDNSEIADDTTSIILESACFNSTSVRRTAKVLVCVPKRRVGLKRLPPEQAPLAAFRFLQLLAQITADPLQACALIDVNAGNVPVISVNMRLHDLKRISGVDIGLETAAESCLLGFPVTIHDDASLSVDVPYWRRADIALSEDLDRRGGAPSWV
jgi:phenylalanyl-tRNA synthetase beta chain